MDFTLYRGPNPTPTMATANYPNPTLTQKTMHSADIVAPGSTLLTHPQRRRVHVATPRRGLTLQVQIYL